MPTTAFLAGYYGLRQDASEQFVRGYVDELMRLDQRGQGVPCGRSWISRSKKCSREKASQTSAEDKKRAVKKSRDRLRLKRQVKAAKGKKAYEKNNPSPEFVEKWGDAAWKDTPADVKAVIDGLPKPREITEEEAKKSGSHNAGAFQSSGGAGFSGIYMGSHQPDGPGRDNAVYRHEYGHHVDHMLSGEHRKEKIRLQQRRRELDKKRKEIFDQSQKLAKEMLPSGWREVKKVWDDFRKKTAFIDKEYAELSKTINDQWNTTDYASSSEKSLDTMRQDADRLRKAKANATKKMRRDLKAKLTEAYDPETKKYDPFKLRKSGATLRQRDQIQEMEKSGKAPSPNAVMKQIFADDKEVKNATVERLGREIFFDDAFDLDSMPKAVQAVGRRISSFSPDGELFKSDKTNLMLAARYGDPEPFLKLAELSTAHTNLFQDLAGSITKNEIGRGHSDDYYSTEDRQSVEAFANVFAFLSSGDPLQEEISAYIAPGYTKFVKSLIKDYNRGSRRSQRNRKA